MADRCPLPKGLYYCRFCEEVAGHLGETKSTCLREGIPCSYCGIGRNRRPTSDHYALGLPIERTLQLDR